MVKRKNVIGILVILTAALMISVSIFAGVANSSNKSENPDVSATDSAVSMGLVLSSYSYSTLNPVTVTYSASGINVLFYLPLTYIEYPPHAGVHMMLLGSYNHNSNYTIWNLTLKPNLKWDNGQPINATDLAFSLNYYNASADPIDEGFSHNATVINSTTVQVEFPHSVPNLLMTLGGGAYYVIPMQTFSKLNPKDADNYTNFNNIISDGPYVITNYTTGENPIIFHANPYFYLGEPKIKEMILHIYDSTSAEVAALKTGVISAAWVGGSYTTAKPFKTPGYTLTPTVPAGIENILLDYMQYPFNNTNVRLALTYAVNRTELAYVGYGSHNYTLLNYAGLTSGYDKTLGISSNSLPNYTQNLSMVTKLMTGAGFHMVNGYWENSTGAPITINLVYPDYEIESTDISLILGQEWKAAGFHVNIEPETSTDFTSTQYGSPPTWGAIVWDGYGEGVDEDAYVTDLYNFWIDYGTPEFEKYVVNTSLDNIWSDYFASDEYPYNSTEGLHYNREIADAIASQVPIIPLYYTYNFEAVSNNYYWGSSSNDTGIYTPQSFTMPQFWTGTLVDVHKVTSTKAQINPYIYIIVAVFVAAVIAGVSISVMRKRSRQRKDE